NCSKSKGDRSLSVHLDGGEKYYKCHRCNLKGKIGDSTPAAAPRYFYYKDENGKPLSRKVRIGDGPTKKIWQERPDGQGGWIKGTKDVRRVLYNSDQLVKAAPGDLVLLHEGEPKADATEEWGYLSTTNYEGASKPHERQKWRPEYSE